MQAVKKRTAAYVHVSLKMRCEDVAALLAWQNASNARYRNVAQSVIGFVRQGFATLARERNTQFKRFYNADAARQYIDEWLAETDVLQGRRAPAPGGQA